jgi:hypothetical protein
MRQALPLLLLPVLTGCFESPAPLAPPASGQAPAPAAPTPPGEEGPDLSHVRVGQRYTFHLDQAGSQADMVWEVRRVGAGRVDYAVSMIKNGTSLGEPGEASWSIASPPPPAPHTHDPEEEQPRPAASKAKVSYEELKLGGRTWRARLTVSEDVRTWTAVAGEIDTFPPLLKQEKSGVVTTVLTKVEEPR